MIPKTKNKNLQKTKAKQILELKHALAYAKGIIDTMREPLVVLYPKLTIVSVNKAFYKTFKTDKTATVGKHIYEIGNRQFDIPLLRKLLEKILVKKNSFNNFEVKNNFATTGPKILLLNARKLNIVGKDDPMILLAIEDITERKSLEINVDIEKNKVAAHRHLLELTAQKVDFITIASHELKTPVTTIKAYTQLMQLTFAAEGNTDAVKMLTLMDTQINKLTHLINHLLESAKVIKGKLKYT
jgi:signal transduction histidine kinase